MSTGNFVREGESGQELGKRNLAEAGNDGEEPTGGGLTRYEKARNKAVLGTKSWRGQRSIAPTKTGIIAAGFLFGGRASHKAAWDNLQEC